MANGKVGRPRKSAPKRAALPAQVNMMTKIVDADMAAAGELDDRQRHSSSAARLRWARFAEAFFETANGTEAYKMAGYHVTTEGSATAGGSRLLAEPFVQAYLMRLHAGDGKVEEPVKPSDEDKEILIADDSEILMLLTAQMRSTSLPARSRLDAAKELAKLKGLYAEKVAPIAEEDVDQAIRSALGLDDED